MKRLSVLVVVVLVVLMVHGWGGSAVGVSTLALCTTDCTGMNDGVKIPDPYNCTTFYVCNNGNPIGPLPCEPGNAFEPSIGECASSTTECKPICRGANCPLTCNGTVIAIGDAFDCSTYYYCTVDGASDPFTCIEELPYYNGNTFSCTTDPSVCCSGYCTPYCSSSNFSLTPDPENCNMYYVCFEEGEANPDYHLSCDEGHVFSVQIGDCVPDTVEPCVKLCDAVGGGHRSSTTTTTTDSNGCVTSLVCTAEGNFPACIDCQPEYFQCSGEGAMGVLDSCNKDTVFNPTPGYPYCVPPSSCPYP